MNNKFLPNEILNIIFSYREPHPIVKELKFYIENLNRLPFYYNFSPYVLNKVIFRKPHSIISINHLFEIIRGYNIWTDDCDDKTYVNFSNYVINVKDKYITKDGYLLSYTDNDALRCCFLQPN